MSKKRKISQVISDVLKDAEPLDNETIDIEEAIELAQNKIPEMTEQIKEIEKTVIKTKKDLSRIALKYHKFIKEK